MPRTLVAFMVFATLLLGSRGNAGSPGRFGAQSESGLATPLTLDPREPLPVGAESWVESTLAGMDLRERVGQVLMARAFGEYYPVDARQRRELVELVQELALGGIVLFRSQAFEAAALLDDLQRAAHDAGVLPMLVAADFEWGADFRIDGAVSFPTAMAVGATGDPMAAEWMGRASARDARALGIHWIFAPVADVNVNPRNPVINVRAFGEDPELVGAMVAAFTRGAQEEGVLATAKHFPGHGDTSVDSHLALPVLDADARRLQAVELAPFRAAIDAGVSSIMTAHMAVPALTADASLPATLSTAVLTDLLRQQLDFKGLVVTDAMEMGGIARRWWSGQAAVEAVRAGADVVLLPPFIRAVHAAIVRAVESGDLEPERLDDAVRRVLGVKARLGLTERTLPPSLAGLPGRFAFASEAVRAREVGGAAVTVLRDKSSLLPLDARRPLGITVVGISDNNSPAPTEALVRELSTQFDEVSSFSVDGRTRGDEAARIIAAAARADRVVLAVRVRVRSSSGRISLPPRQNEIANTLATLRTPTIAVALGSPYAIAGFPSASAALVAYGWSESLQEAVADVLLGARAVTGKLPVTIPGLYPKGYGLERPALDTRLVNAADGVERVGVRPEDLGAAHRAIEDAIEAGAFPGAVYAVGHRGVLATVASAGRMSWAPGAPRMSIDAVFDIASMTKVVATTTMAMQAVESGSLRLDSPVQGLLPEFVGQGKDTVTVRHLLTHTSGLPAYVEYFRDYDPSSVDVETREQILTRIYDAPLEVEPGTRTEYSDLGIILLGEVLTRALGELFWEVADEEIFEPLGMRDTTWNPPNEWRSRIPPTEDDPWRGRVVHGEVHDENAYALGGFSSHAGLFSTAIDLGTFAQMMLNGGTYDHRRYLRRWTVTSWTRRQGLVAGSSRALGWDTALPGGRWEMFSDSAYGHTGFTGTSIWIDPARDLFVVLLTNRVHPTRENRRHIDARVAFHTAVVDAVDAVAARR